LNVDRSSDSSGEDGGRKLGRAPGIHIRRVHRGRRLGSDANLLSSPKCARMRVLCHWRTSRLCPIAAMSTGSSAVLNTSCGELMHLVAWPRQSPEIWRKRVKRAKPRRRHFDSPMGPQATTPASGYTATLWSPLFQQAKCWPLGETTATAGSSLE
jgi:hypothetical protein